MGFKELIKKYSKSDVNFTKHAKIKISQLMLNENFIVNKLFDIEKLIYEEYQKSTNTFKLIYEHSRKYSFVIVVSLNKNINIVTVYKTSKKIQKLIRDAGIIYISKRI
jgi:hypothetical protein